MPFPDGLIAFGNKTKMPVSGAMPGWNRLGAPTKGLLLVSVAVMAFGVARGSIAGAVAGQEETEAGIPVTDKLTREKCGTCHTPDAQGNLSRISWLRTTPEA